MRELRTPAQPGLFAQCDADDSCAADEGVRRAAEVRLGRLVCVPDLAGFEPAAAFARLRELELIPAPQPTLGPYPGLAGQVVSQHPPAGGAAARNTPVVLFVAPLAAPVVEQGREPVACAELEAGATAQAAGCGDPWIEAALAAASSVGAQLVSARASTDDVVRGQQPTTCSGTDGDDSTLDKPRERAAADGAAPGGRRGLRRPVVIGSALAATLAVAGLMANAKHQQAPPRPAALEQRTLPARPRRSAGRSRRVPTRRSVAPPQRQRDRSLPAQPPPAARELAPSVAPVRTAGSGRAPAPPLGAWSDDFGP